MSNSLVSWSELQAYLKDQGMTESEIKDMVEFYNMQIEEGSQYDKEGYTINVIKDASDWVEEICDSIQFDKNHMFGDIGSFLKLHYIADYEEFAMEYADYIMEYDDAFVMYCPSTKRIVFFSA